MVADKSQRFELVAPPSWFAAVDQWRRLQPDLPSRAEAIRRLVDRGLANPETQVRLQPDLLNALDQWITEDGDLVGNPNMSRPEAIRRLVVEALQKLGVYPSK